MKRCIFGMLALFACTSFAETLLIKNTVYLNPDNNRVEPISILIDSQRITQLFTKVPLTIDADQILDAKGSFLLPGMVDMHTHSWGNSGLRSNNEYQYIGYRGTASAYLFAGVHGALDLASDEDNILGYHSNDFPKTRDEAYLFAAGPCFTASGGHCSQMGDATRIINSPADVEKHLNELAPKNPNVVKVVLHGNEYLPTIDEATLRAFLQKAKSLNIPSVVHVGSWEEVRLASQHGASAVTHLPWTPMPADIPALMKANNTSMIPTIGLLAELMHLKEQSNLPGPVGTLTKTLVSKKLLAQFPLSKEDERYQTWLQKQHKSEALFHISQSLLSLLKAGVIILPGSDAANEAMYQGVGLHRELAHLQAMGVPAHYLLTAVTHKAHQFLGLDWGVKIGASANFVLVNPDVVHNINLTADIQHVVLNGRIVDRQPLLHFAKPDWWQYTKLFLGFED